MCQGPFCHHKMQSESSMVFGQGSQSRLVPNSNTCSTVPVRKPRVQIGSQNKGFIISRKNTVHNNTPKNNQPTQQKQRAQTPPNQDQLLNRSSPRGSKRPCTSPNSGLPSASRGMRCYSPNKNVSPTAPLKNSRTSPLQVLPNGSSGSRVASPSKGSNNMSPVPSDTEDKLAFVYAGAKFSDPPSPKVLPKPPMHWVISGRASSVSMSGARTCSEMTNVLKVMLKVQG